MAKTVIFLFHGDNDSLNAGSHVAERVRQVSSAAGVDLEVFCFGPAQSAMTEVSADAVRVESRAQIDALVAAGVRVGACANAAIANAQDEELTARGVTLEFARDAFIRFAVDGAAVLSF